MIAWMVETFTQKPTPLPFIYPCYQDVKALSLLFPSRWQWTGPFSSLILSFLTGIKKTSWRPPITKSLIFRDSLWLVGAKPIFKVKWESLWALERRGNLERTVAAELRSLRTGKGSDCGSHSSHYLPPHHNLSFWRLPEVYLVWGVAW